MPWPSEEVANLMGDSMSHDPGLGIRVPIIIMLIRIVISVWIGGSWKFHVAVIVDVKWV